MVHDSDGNIMMLDMRVHNVGVLFWFVVRVLVLLVNDLLHNHGFVMNGLFMSDDCFMVDDWFTNNMNSLV